MGNCLVTKLKSVVENDNLKKLGVIKLSAVNDTADTQTYRLIYFQASGGDITIKTTGEGYMSTSSSLANPVTEFVINPSAGRKGLYFSISSEYDIEIHNKYYLKVINATGRRLLCNFDDFYMTTALEELNIARDYDSIGNIKNFTNSPLKILFTYGSYVKGNLSEISSKTEMTQIRLDSESIKGNLTDLSAMNNLEYISLFRTNVSGSIESLGSFINLNYINLGLTKCSGNISDFVSAQVNATRTTVLKTSPINVSSNFSGSTNTINFDGTKPMEVYLYLTWDNASQIVIWAGSTSGIDNATKVYVKGYGS